ncbi:hypothetical protein D3C72_2303400 [compost metagenome]
MALQQKFCPLVGRLFAGPGLYLQLFLGQARAKCLEPQRRPHRLVIARPKRRINEGVEVFTADVFACDQVDVAMAVVVVGEVLNDAAAVAG